ncbi:MAG: ATPase, T2SS/T4P/T4SS family [Clostridia bacterium]
MKYNQSILNAFIKAEYVKKSDEEKFIKLAESNKTSVDKLLLSENIVTEAQYAAVMAEYVGLSYADFDSFYVNKMVQGKVSNYFIKRHRAIPIDINEFGVMTVAIASPLDFYTISAVNSVAIGMKNFVVCNPIKIDNYISSLFASGATTSAIGDLQAEAASLSKELISSNVNNDTVNAPAVRLVDSIIREAIPMRASDIHVEPYEYKVRVRYRIDGELTERFEFSIDSFPAVLARLKILANINIAERRIPQDGRIEMKINGIDYDFRVSTLPTAHGEKVVVRILDKNAFALSRSKLGFTDHENILINKFLTQPHGIVLLTGPTGCGKSTTLYSFLQEVNKPSVNIVTVEDPIEYTIGGINQVQVNMRAGLTFATSLRSILRQDPNIIMIGEMRDEETAQIAIRAAITGHLVFSTLHTNDAPGCVTRLLDMNIEPYLLSDALVGVISQRLVKVLCPYCKEKVVTGPNLTKSLGLESPTEIYEQRGCRYCNNTGYRGRTAVHEVLAITDKLKSAIAEKRTLDDIRYLALEGGMVPLWESARNLVLNGITSVAELLAITEK